MDSLTTPNPQKLIEDKKLYGRLDEYIQTALSHRTLNLCGVVIKGHSGTGKTFFVESYLQQFVPAYPLLIARHNPQQEAIPYAGFRHGIGDFMNNAFHHLGKEKYQQFSSSLKSRLGDNLHLLCDYIPELALLLDKHTNVGGRSNLKLENQLYPSFKGLFTTLSEFYQKPILFFTDDLQFMDGPGMNLLKYLLLQLAPQQLIWVGAYREPQRNFFPINQLLDALHLDKKYVENISLKEFTLAQGQFFMERWLGAPCSPQLTEICHRLSEANSSQLQVLLESLRKDQLIYRNSEGLWEGDHPHILKQYQGQNAPRIVRERMDQLTGETQELLCLMACMGGFNRRLLLEHLEGNEELLAFCLHTAGRSGLLAPEENGYRFSESHIGEMIYEGMSPEQKSSYHYHIAKLLHQRQGGRLAFSKQIMMTGHFNQALDQVRRNGELEFCAALNFQAGSLYKQNQIFDQAKMYFKISGDLYKECPWERVKDQLWEVYLERAKVEYALGEYELAEIHLDYLLDRFREPLSRTEAFELKIVINSHLGRYRKVVGILKESLSELGLELPLEEPRLLQEINGLKSRLSSGESGGLDNPSIEVQPTILKLLSVGGMGLHHTSDILMTWAALQIIARSRTVQSPVRALGYVSYGRMHIISGEIQQGVELGRTGLDHTVAQQDPQYRCRVFGVFAFYIQPWQNAFLDSLPLLEEGMNAGRETGDLIGLYILKTHQFNLHFISGAPIEELLQYDFEEFYPGRELTYYITHYQKSLIRFLIGETAAFSIPRPQTATLAANLTIQEEKFYRNHVSARYYFLFGYYELAMQYGREAHQNRKLQEGSPLVPANLQIIFLSITQNWDNGPPPMRVPLLQELREMITQMEMWSAHAPVNYLAVLDLFYAEWYRIQGEADEKIEAAYSDSLAHAGANIYLKALTHETFARYYLSKQAQAEKAQVHLVQAIREYRRWGGLAKVRQLFQQYHFLLKEDWSHKHDLDIEMVLRELSGDLDFRSLLQKLMTLLLRVSGSTRVAVEWMEHAGEAKGREVMDLLSSQTERTIPAGLMAMAQRTQELVIANDLKEKSLLSEVTLLEEQGVKSFVILPITLSESYSMAIYLENRFEANGYQKDQMKWIRITANQGAVVIENARTHEKTVKLNEKIQQEMAEKQQLAAQIEAQKDAHLRQMIDTQESERKRIAGDLHDSLGSLLSGIKFRLNGLKETSALSQPEEEPLYREMLSQLDEAVEEVRRIAHNMSPVSLRRFGLPKALHALIEQINSSNRLDATLQLLGLESRLPEQLELTVYRICQELVQNAVKHAHSNQLHLQIIRHPDVLNIMVEDNGLGMDVHQVKPGFGFAAIQAKVKLLQGNFSIESQPGKGCTAIVDIPFGAV